MQGRIAAALRGIAQSLGGDGCCAGCREWPAFAVLSDDTPDGTLALTPMTLARFGLPKGAPFTQCPHCGWLSNVKVIVYMVSSVT